MSSIGDSPAFPRSAQSIFDAIQSGDEALRAKVNQAAAEAEGWTRGAWTVAPEYGPNAGKKWQTKGWIKGQEKALDYQLPDYTRSLDAAARLRLPENRIMRTWHKSGGQNGAIGLTVSIENGSPAKAEIAYAITCGAADEALARAVCWYVATGGGK